MNKNGIFAKLLREKIEREKKRYSSKPIDLFTDQKRQLWYSMMSRMDGFEDTAGSDSRKEASGEGGSAV